MKLRSLLEYNRQCYRIQSRICICRLLWMLIYRLFTQTLCKFVSSSFSLVAMRRQLRWRLWAACPCKATDCYQTLNWKADVQASTSTRTHTCVCVWVCARARARVLAYVCVCVCVWISTPQVDALCRYYVTTLSEDLIKHWRGSTLVLNVGSIAPEYTMLYTFTALKTSNLILFFIFAVNLWYCR
jgi:hypothetical protein